MNVSDSLKWCCPEASYATTERIRKLSIPERVSVHGMLPLLPLNTGGGNAEGISGYISDIVSIV
jgi:hypothetical protein